MADCEPPGEIFDSGATRQAFGALVERIVQKYYCAYRATSNYGACELFIPPSLGGARSDFFDEDAGVTRCASFGSYLKFHNSQVNEQALVNACTASHPKPLLVKIPDIITHRFMSNLFEFYEVKPNSPSGRGSGRSKIIWFMALCLDPATGARVLPYTPGVLWTPNIMHSLALGQSLGAPLTINVHIFRPPPEPALILYEICPDPKNPSQGKCAAVLMRGAAIWALLRTQAEAADLEPRVQALVRVPETPLQQAVGSIGPGEDAPNLPDDVRYVQALLNDWRARSGLPVVDVNGTWMEGGETDLAIRALRLELLGDESGLLEPDVYPMGALEEYHIRSVFEAGEAAIESGDFPGILDSPIFTDEGADDDEEVATDEGVTAEMLSSAIDDEMRPYLKLLYADLNS